MPLYKFTAEFTVRAETQKEAECEVQEELGYDVFEAHCLCEEIKDTSQEADIDLIAESKVGSV